MHTFLKSFFFLSLFFGPVLLHAQEPGGDFFREIGKIYVVVAVILALFFGIVAYLFYLDRKLTRLEKQLQEHD